MRVLILCPELFRSEGGIARMMRLYARAACDDPNVTSVELVVLHDHEIPEAKLTLYTGPKLARATGCGGSRFAFGLQVLRAMQRADRVICGHIHLLPLAWLARGISSRIRLYVVAHGIEVWSPPTSLQRRALHGTSGIWCVSAYTLKTLSALCESHVPRSRFKVMPNALDPVLLPEGPVLARPRIGPPTLLSVSRLDRRDRYKGIDHLIQALPRVRSSVPEARLRIVGSGDDSSRLASLAIEQGVASAVEFPGRLSDAALRSELRECDVVALPSEKEGFGLVYLEAFAQGKPAIGARAGGTPEVIEEGKNGLLVPYGDVSALATACIEALTRAWDPEAIKAHAEAFSFEAFRSRLHAAW